MIGTKRLLFINTDEGLLKKYSSSYEIEVVSSVSVMDIIAGRFVPDMIFVNSVSEARIADIRKDENLWQVPVVVLAENFSELNNLNAVSDFPKVLVCNRIVAESPQFMAGVEALCCHKKNLLPSKTSRIVKYAVLFMNKNIGRQLTREQFAQQLGVSVDYLTRIFHKEMGISLWDYLNLYRLHIAHRLLLQSDLPVAEVAHRTGFPDAAYFSRVFRKQYGVAPMKIRRL